MASPVQVELQRLNAEIVGYLLTQCSPPRELVARREVLRAVARPEEGEERLAFEPPHPLRRIF